MMPRLQNPVSASIAEFLAGIGLVVQAGEITGSSFVPGIQIAGGILVVDEDRMTYPGDMLHEAGHLAVLEPHERAQVNWSAGKDAGEEMAAIAWSYAAAVHLGLDPSIVFHESGYRGASASLIENFSAGRYVGVPLLQWMGMTDRQAYPAMQRWLRAANSANASRQETLG